MSVPPRSADERAAALATALAARRERALLRARLRDGSLTATAVLAELPVPAPWASVRVSWLLEAVPGIGPARCEVLMDRAGIAATRRLRGVGIHQRAALLDLLAGR
jgi:hypothetical protein